jgi:UDP-3-O-[3-hydroxymyristoyl] glucosamine N-acyltransferase
LGGDQHCFEGEKMELRLADIANKIGATLINGSDETVITGAASLDVAESTEISFLSNPRYVEQAMVTKAAAVIMARDVADITTAKLITPNPYLAWARALELFVPDRSQHYREAFMPLQ